MADILTLNEYRAFAGYDPTDTSDDTKVTARLSAVSQAIRAFTERDFGASSVTEQRTYEYDGSGYLDIDDAATIIDVAVSNGGTDVALDSNMWQPKPERRDDAPIYQYILLPPFLGASLQSPEMGFARNLDVYFREHQIWGFPTKVKVNATWGWPVIPEDVKLAAYWTLREWLERDDGEGLQAEAIEGWSRSWGRSGEVAVAMAIPPRARDILANYSKMNA